MINNAVSGSSLFLSLCNIIENQEKDLLKSEALRKDVESMFNTVVELVQTRLIRAISPFWGVALMGVGKNIDWKQRGFVDLRIGRPVILSFNPFFIKDIKSPSGEYDIRNFIGYIVTELLRLIYQHPSYYSKFSVFNNNNATKQKLELASDVNVSEMMKDDKNKQLNDIRMEHGMDNSGKINVIKDDMKILIPEKIMSLDKLNVLTKQSLQSSKALEYYYHSIKDIDIPPMPFSGGGSENDGDESDENNPDGLATPSNTEGHEVHEWMNSGQDSSEMETMIKEYLSQVAMKTRGTCSGGIMDDIEKSLRPPERSYKELFADMIYASDSTDTIPTRMRLNRRQPDRLDLCGKRGVSHKHVYIALDTSGSTTKFLKKFLNETLSIAKEANATVTIIECDARIHKVYDASDDREIQFKLKGFGGTAFTPVIEFINGKNIPEEFKQYWRHPDDSVLCYFTDGYGESEIPKPLVKKVLWVSVDGYMSLRQPYGKVVSIKGTE